jgi:transposase
MAWGCLEMSAAEVERSHLVRAFLDGHLGQRAASERLGIGVRQFKRLVRAWRSEGDAGLVSRQRGRPSNRRLDDARRAAIAALLRGKYAGFGATLASEKLAELDGIAVSVETVRGMQISLGLWRPKARRVKRLFQLRERRARFGELIQIDGSPHDWFEGRGPRRAEGALFARSTLIVFIDDATGRLTSLRFAPVESGAAYLDALRDHVLTHGCPLAFYSDRHGIFRVNAKDAQRGDGKTEFGRVVERLEIGLIHALTPQAKGRVERANQTLQDRLVKELRLRNICSMAAAQAYLPEFIIEWNKKFAVPPRDAASAHRPWTQPAEALDLALASHEERVLTKALTFSYGGTKYCVQTPGPGRALRGAKIAVHRFHDGRLRFSHKERVLTCTAYGSYAVADPAEDEKTLDARVDAIAAARRPVVREVAALAA